MTLLSLRNPVAILMLCVGLVVFAGVVTPRMPIDTFPELTPPVLIIGAGIGGLTLALLLRQRGITAEVLEPRVEEPDVDLPARRLSVRIPSRAVRAGQGAD